MLDWKHCFNECWEIVFWMDIALFSSSSVSHGHTKIILILQYKDLLPGNPRNSVWPDEIVLIIAVG